jgi:hypothetical protein
LGFYLWLQDAHKPQKTEVTWPNIWANYLERALSSTWPPVTEVQGYGDGMPSPFTFSKCTVRNWNGRWGWTFKPNFRNLGARFHIWSFLGGCCQGLARLVPYPYLSLRALRTVATRGNPPWISLDGPRISRDMG